MQSLSVLAVLACCGSLAASAVRPRRSLPLPDGLPLEQLFSTCGGGSDSSDIGPCVKQLLSDLVELATPAFETGLEVGGKMVVLEPLSLGDIPAKEKSGQQVRVSATDVQLAGLSSVQVGDVSLLPDRLALNLSFAELRASGVVLLQLLVFTGRPQVEVILARPSVRVEAGWQLQTVDGKLGIRLSNPAVSVDIQALSARVSDLGNKLGGFLQMLIDRSHDALLDVFKTALEKKATRLLEKKFSTIKLDS